MSKAYHKYDIHKVPSLRSYTCHGNPDPQMASRITLSPNLPTIPPPLPRLSFLILSILITRATLSLAVFCTESYPNAEYAALPSDCQYILAHVPSIPVPDASSRGDAHPFLNPSMPFFPIAEIWHGTCGFLFVIMNSTKDEPPQSVKLTSRTALEAWAQMQEDAASIITQCVQYRQQGAVSRDMDHVLPGLSYSTMSDGDGTPRPWPVDQRRAMELHADHPLYPHYQLPHYPRFLFSRTFYTV